MAGAEKKSLYVTAPLVAVTVGEAVKQLRHGDLVTEGVSKESLDHLKSLGFVSDTNPLDAKK